MVSLWSLGEHLEHLEGDLGRLRELGEHQVAQREAMGSPKLKSQVQTGAIRADKGCVPAACGEPLGEGGAEASPLVLGISLARPSHAEAWGGGFNCFAHSAGPCMESQGDYYFN